MPLFQVTPTLNLFNEPKINLKAFFGQQAARVPQGTQEFLGRITGVLTHYAIEPALFLRLVPKKWDWTMRETGTPEGLLGAWQTRQADWFCEQFRVEPQWLETGKGWMLPTLPGYKNPGDTLKALKEMGWLDDQLRMTLLVVDDHDGAGGIGDYQIVFSRPIASLYGDGRCVYAHQLFDAEWNYALPASRWDTKALARWFYKHHHGHAIPMVPIPRAVDDALRKGQCLVPHFNPDATGRLQRFEDRVLAASESAIARETHELDTVLAHMKAHLAAWM